jgi:hypothetical protein
LYADTQWISLIADTQWISLHSGFPFTVDFPCAYHTLTCSRPAPPRSAADRSLRLWRASERAFPDTPPCQTNTLTPAINEGCTRSLSISHTSRRAPLQPVPKAQVPCTPYHPLNRTGVRYAVGCLGSAHDRGRRPPGSQDTPPPHGE